jgi:hypothetical protein
VCFLPLSCLGSGSEHPSVERFVQREHGECASSLSRVWALVQSIPRLNGSFNASTESLVGGKLLKQFSHQVIVCLLRASDLRRSTFILVTHVRFCAVALLSQACLADDGHQQSVLHLRLHRQCGSLLHARYGTTSPGQREDAARLDAGARSRCMKRATCLGVQQ